MDSWKRFNEAPLRGKIKFYSGLNIEKSTNSDYKHTKKVWKNFASSRGHIFAFRCI